MSANHRMEDLGDVQRRRMDLAAICPSCGATAVFDPAALTSHAILRSRSTRIDQVAARMRCIGCGHRGLGLRLASPELRTRFAPAAPLPWPLFFLPAGPARLELRAAERAYAAAEREADGSLPAAVALSDARERLRRARSAWRNILAGKLDL